jgi:WD40 repeat protein
MVGLPVCLSSASLSPDGRTLICVGDNHEVYLYEVISGGSDFRLIRTYRASDDAGFSTSWSKDGKKFAVASQDGVVTVWDHRYALNLAIPSFVL